MKIRFEKGKTLLGTRIYHHFVPQSKCKISYKITSDEGILSGSFNLYDKKSLELDLNIIKISKFVTCQYDAIWWIGMIQNIDEAGDILVKFLHPHGPSKSFYWPSQDG